VPASLTKVMGDSQQVTVGTTAPLPLVVEVTDSRGTAINGVLVSFTTDSGNGSLLPNAVTTGPDGRAQSAWTVPTVTGTYHTKASVAGIDSVTFTAVTAAGGATQLVVVTADTLGADAGAVLDSAVVVELRDGFGNGVAGADLAIQVAGGGSAPATITTDSAGRATLTWRLAAVASVNGLSISHSGLLPVTATAFGFPPLLPSRLSTGDRHACRLIASGAAYCWGQNRLGQLGTGDTITHFTPSPVGGGLTFSAIGAGNFLFSAGGISCGLVADSTTYCWGAVGTARNQSPVALIGPRFSQITVGGGHACGVTGDGTGYCWGLNDQGQLGDGGTTTQDAPTLIAGGLRFRQLTAGGAFTCGVTLRAEVYCWGNDLNGEIGHGTSNSTNQLVPLRVGSGLRLATVASGTNHSCGTSFAGELYCWGSNGQGQSSAGPGPFQQQPTVILPGAGLVELAPGYEHTCGLDATGIASCWGRNSELALGDSIFGERRAPAPVLGGISFTELDAGFSVGCGLTPGDALYCWGSSSYGALGIADTTQRLLPVPVTGGHTFTSISVGFWHSCGLDAQHMAWCWGENGVYPLLGIGVASPHAIPVPVGGAHQFAKLRAGGYGTCGLDLQGAAWCWGDGRSGEIGDGVLVERSIPTAVSGGHVFTDIDVGFVQACGLTAPGEVWCWGSGDAIGNVTPYGLPVQVSAPEAFTSVSVGTRMACGLGQSGVGLCWPARGDSVSPVATAVDTLRFTQVEAGFYGGCGLVASGDPYCWSSINGGTGLPTLIPGGLQFARLDVSFWGQTICGVTAAGAAYCWGDNTGGQFGNGTTDPFPTPIPAAVAGSLTFQDVTASSFHACGLATNGSAYCWGTSAQGALGTGDSIYHPFPVPVSP
jgi:alpha-tubulin suppressor-like RCC1 family protein